MKAILISIKPKWVVKILNGEKTIEIRKTMPKCDFPIDVYIYCTKDKKDYLCKPNEWGMPFPKAYALGGKCCKNYNGKVVAKFTLNKVEEIEYLADDYCTETYRQKELIRRCCLTDMELHNYLEHKIGHAWHISNLKIFDKPKELSEFYSYCKDEKCEYRNNHCSICYRASLTKAPESWCYVESE